MVNFLDDMPLSPELIEHGLSMLPIRQAHRHHFGDYLPTRSAWKSGLAANLGRGIKRFIDSSSSNAMIITTLEPDSLHRRQMFDTTLGGRMHIKKVDGKLAVAEIVGTQDIALTVDKTLVVLELSSAEPIDMQSYALSLPDLAHLVQSRQVAIEWTTPGSWLGNVKM